MRSLLGGKNIFSELRINSVDSANRIFRCAQSAVVWKNYDMEMQKKESQQVLGKQQ